MRVRAPGEALVGVRTVDSVGHGVVGADVYVGKLHELRVDILDLRLRVSFFFLSHFVVFGNAWEVTGEWKS